MSTVATVLEVRFTSTSGRRDQISAPYRVWETQAVTKFKARHTTAFWVRNGDRYFITNDSGDLIIAKLAPDGYHEISRTQLIKPTWQANRRMVNWTFPAYVNKHLITRNDEEIISISLSTRLRSALRTPHSASRHLDTKCRVC